MRTPNNIERVLIDTIESCENITPIEVAFIWISSIVNIGNIITQEIIRNTQPPIKKGEVVLASSISDHGELINLPDGSKIIPHNIAEQIAKSNNKLNIKVNLNGEECVL